MAFFILIKSSLLGIIQGLGEFLPISSTAHLIIFEKLFGLSSQEFGLSFDAFLHLGTLLALLWFFKKDLWDLIKGVFSELNARRLGLNIKLAILLVVGSLPAGFLGLLLESKIESSFRSLYLISLALIGFSVVIWLVERFAKVSKTADNLKASHSFLIGLFQSLALIPGVSRSGSSIVGGLLVGLSELEAARFSFLLSIPVITGAGLKKVLEISLANPNPDQLIYYFSGLLFSSLTGFLAIKYFLRYLQKNGLGMFVVYRILLGIVLLGLLLMGKI